MSGYEEQELIAIDAALDANPDATSNEVFQATRPYDERAIASVAAARAGGGGGGSIAANDGSATSIPVVTELQFPAGSLTDDGGGYVEVAFFAARTLSNDAILEQGSGTVVLAQSYWDYVWQQIGDVVTCSFAILTDTGTAGEAGQPVFVSFPAIPLPRFVSGRDSGGDASPSCGVAHLEVGATSLWGFIEVGDRGDGIARVTFDKTDTVLVGSGETLGAGDSLKGTFSYFAAT